MLFAPACVACRQPGRALCEACAAELEPALVLPPPAGVEWCASLLAYDGRGRDLVVNLKYRNAREVVGVVVPPLADLVGFAPIAPDTITWAPTTAARRRRRGFDQARLLAAGVGRHLAVPVEPLLERLPSAPQTGSGLADRLDRPRFRARGRVPPDVLVIDDVRTSGGTLSAAAAALGARGAKRIIAVTLAHTPLNHPAQNADNGKRLAPGVYHKGMDDAAD
ncbi:MAG: ComF family protein [Actinobacteria bacterium]|nr:ComF family protein [Actinomycetota bacterium]